MKSPLASSTELAGLTGSENPERQYQVLCELGCRPIFTDGKVRIYRDALIKVQAGENALWHKPPKPNRADLTSDGLTVLYRHWGNGKLLYVGVSLSALDRTRKHSDTAHWFDQVDTITLERFTTRAKALAAERAAIATEKPAHNVMGVT